MQELAIVKYADGDYGIRKDSGGVFGLDTAGLFEHLDLTALQTKGRVAWKKNPEYACRATTYNEVEKALKSLTNLVDNGEPVEKAK
jgi:hypothetical protein